MTWWRQKASEDHLSVTVKDILAAARVRRQQEYGRRDGSEGKSEGGNTDSDEYDRGGRNRYAGTETGDYQVGR